MNALSFYKISAKTVRRRVRGKHVKRDTTCDRTWAVPSSISSWVHTPRGMVTGSFLNRVGLERMFGNIVQNGAAMFGGVGLPALGASIIAYTGSPGPVAGDVEATRKTPGYFVPIRFCFAM